MSTQPWDRLDAELLDTIQADRISRGKPFNVRTRETRRAWPRPTSRTRPTLICAYCGRLRCEDHADLPALDPYFTEARQ